jgi:hypothetical protein
MAHFAATIRIGECLLHNLIAQVHAHFIIYGKNLISLVAMSADLSTTPVFCIKYFNN